MPAPHGPCATHSNGNIETKGQADGCVCCGHTHSGGDSCRLFISCLYSAARFWGGGGRAESLYLIKTWEVMRNWQLKVSRGWSVGIWERVLEVAPNRLFTLLCSGSIPRCSTKTQVSCGLAMCLCGPHGYRHGQFCGGFFPYPLQFFLDSSDSPPPYWKPLTMVSLRLLLLSFWAHWVHTPVSGTYLKLS